MENNVEKFREQANNLMLDKRYGELISLCDEKLAKKQVQTLVNSYDNNQDNNNIINIETSWYDKQGNLIKSKCQDYYYI